jgi:uncharacterized CHY-type Zn-finger protein
MPFSESVKLEAKCKAHFACVACHQPFVEVHHIIPQAQGGSDDIDNAAALCAYCHDLIGGNPEKRKQIRQMRDFWYEFCEKRFRDSASSHLNAEIETIKATQHEHGALLSGIKHAFEHYYTTQGVQLAEATTFSAVAGITGAYIPVTKSNK